MFETRDQWRAGAPGLDTSSMEVVALVKAVSAMFQRAVEPLFDGAALSPPELDVLIALRHDPGPVIARRLADRMHISRPAAGKTLARLEERGLVERMPSPTDRRAQVVTVTAAGREAVDDLFPRQLAVEAELLAGLGEDRVRVVEALSMLVKTMERRSGPHARYR